MEDESGLAFHLKIKKGSVGRYVLLPGNPGRVSKIAAFFDNPIKLASHREFETWTGTLNGIQVSACSTGIGCPSTAIAIEELIWAGADTFIRVGSSGSMQPYVHAGDVAIVQGAIRDEGTTSAYLPLEFPALADLDIVNALREGAKVCGLTYHIGVCQSKDSFYSEVQKTRMPMAKHLDEKWKAYCRGGAVCSEMEASAIFILCSLYGKRGGGVMLIINECDLGDAELKDESTKPHMNDFDPSAMIKVAVEALKILIAQDNSSKKRKK